MGRGDGQVRPIVDWCDLRYREDGHLSHYVPFGADAPLCQVVHEGAAMWAGTGTFEEMERAKGLPLCGFCMKEAHGERDTSDPSVKAWAEAHGQRETGIYKDGI